MYREKNHLSTKHIEENESLKDSENDASETDVVEDIPQNYNIKIPIISRNSVSAEAIGIYYKKEGFQPKVFVKTVGHLEKIKKSLKESFIFAGLESKDLDVLVSSFEEKNFRWGVPFFLYLSFIFRLIKKISADKTYFSISCTKFMIFTKLSKSFFFSYLVLQPVINI